MPKGIDPKAYAARVTKAKKVIAAMDPAMKAKIKEMYPPIKKEAIVNKALSPKKAVAKKAAAKPMAKPTAKATPKTTTKTPAKVTPKPKTTKKPEKMTPEDAAMKKILESKYGKIYG